MQREEKEGETEHEGTQMLIRKYSGRHERVLLKRIRAELGPDAIILHTSFRKPRGFLKYLRP